jgi:hypothetical protein
MTGDSKHISNCREIFLNGILNIFDGFFFSLTLRPTTRQTGAGYAIAFFGFLQEDFIFHYSASRTIIPVSDEDI